MANGAELAYAQYRAAEELEEQARVVLARDLYEGQIDDLLVQELEKALLTGDASNIQALINVYAEVIDGVLDRLEVDQLVDDADPEMAQMVEWAMDYWQAQGLDEYQYSVHLWALRDGESYILLSPEESAAGETVIRPIPHERYTDPQSGGSGEGIKVHYRENERVGLTPVMASKRWTETVWHGERRTTRQRMTLYISDDYDDEPARIEKYVKPRETEQQIWVPLEEEGEEWPIWWTANGTRVGESLPIPVIPFRNLLSRKAGDRAQGSQYILDNQVTALISAGSLHGAPALILMGAYPTTDGQPPNDTGSSSETSASNVLRLGPRQILAFPQLTPDRGSVNRLEPGDLEQILRSIDEVLRLTAITTGTLSLLGQRARGGQVTAEEMRRVGIRPTSITRRTQNTFGNAWSRFFETLAAMNAAFDGSLEIPDGAETVHVQWMPADVLGELPGDDDPDLVARQAKANIAETLVRAGANIRGAAQAAGYNEQEVEEMSAVDIPGGGNPR